MRNILLLTNKHTIEDITKDDIQKLDEMIDEKDKLYINLRELSQP